MSPTTIARLALLLHVDSAPYHALPVTELSPHLESYMAEAIAQRWIRPLDATSRFPARYVVTTRGSHAMGTFEHMCQDIEECIMVDVRY